MPDEGIQKFSFYIVNEIAKIGNLYEIKNIKLKSQETTFKEFLFGRLLLGKKFSDPIRKINPDIIFYIPNPVRSLNFFQSWLLKLYSKNKAKIIIICLQPIREGFLLKKKIMKFFSPHLFFVQSLKEKKQLKELSCKVKLIPSGVDIERFVPISKEIKLGLRKKYNFPLDKLFVLHVGSISKGRNVEILKKIKELLEVEVILVASTTTFRDSNILNMFKGRGINVISDYLTEIQEIYQMSDCYVFPVENEGASIGMPLSILEAMACNLPVITTKFGCMPAFFKEDYCFKYIDKSDDIINRINEIKTIEIPNNREKVLSYSWINIARQILSESLENREWKKS